MITGAYVRTMANYNAEMNRRLYEPAARISDAARRQDRGAYWGSLHGTLNHLLWGDRMWMHRFAAWPAPECGMRDSRFLIEDFAALRAAREAADAAIVEWAAAATESWLAEDLVWFSGALGREMRRPVALLVTHMFNHQTHHRGQAHALITASGERTEDTDLAFIINMAD
jgi:uncharacterized damage-inducible protein DinB